MPHPNNVRAKVALDKQAHPERYCPFPRCLWLTAPRYWQVWQGSSLICDNVESWAEAANKVENEKRAGYSMEVREMRGPGGYCPRHGRPKK